MQTNVTPEDQAVAESAVVAHSFRRFALRAVETRCIRNLVTITGHRVAECEYCRYHGLFIATFICVHTCFSERTLGI